MKILVTGGAGYIGSTLIPELLENGHHVTVVDNFRYGIQSLNAVCHNSRFAVYKADVRDVGFVKSLLQKVDVIIPLAALVGAPLCNQFSSEASSINKAAIFDMLKLLSSDQYVLMPTTNSAYGGGLSGAVCDEDSALNPLSQYAKEKVEVESILMEHKNAVSFRLATVFGMSPRLRTDLLVNDFVLRAWRDGFVVMYEPDFNRNYIHVRDVASAFVHCLNNLENMRGNIYNVGLTEANLSKMELALKIKEHFEHFEIIVAHNFSDPDQRNYIVSNLKLERTGWKPAFDLDAGITELAKGYAMTKKFHDGNI